ncbi:MAG: hypothetical protein ACK50P_05740 [Planctomycetaceae bacterium]
MIRLWFPVISGLVVFLADGLVPVPDDSPLVLMRFRGYCFANVVAWSVVGQ